MSRDVCRIVQKVLTPAADNQEHVCLIHSSIVAMLPMEAVMFHVIIYSAMVLNSLYVYVVSLPCQVFELRCAALALCQGVSHGGNRNELLGAY